MKTFGPELPTKPIQLDQASKALRNPPIVGPCCPWPPTVPTLLPSGLQVNRPMNRAERRTRFLRAKNQPRPAPKPKLPTSSHRS